MRHGHHHGRRLVGVIAILTIGLAAGAASQVRREQAWISDIRVVAGPAAPASAQPQLQASARGLLLSWIETTGSSAALRFAELADGRWSEARTVATGDNWFVNWADVPSVMRRSDGTFAAHWLQRSGSGKYAYDVRLSHSIDGRIWAPSFTPHHDGTATEHGFATLFDLPDGQFGAVWLDGRQTASGSSHGGASHGGASLGSGPAAAGGAMTMRFGAYDRGWQQTVDAPIDARVCDCCPTTAAMTSEGPIVAYRNRTEGEVRDIYVSRLEGGRWTTPAAVHDDGWQVSACPVNGPMLSARGRQVVVAWFTAVGDVGHAYVAFSTDAGRTFGAPVRIDDVASLGRVDVELLPDGSAIASWIELRDPGAGFMVRQITPRGTRTEAVTVASLEGSRTSGYPRLALSGTTLAFAWTETSAGVTSVRTAVATLPSREP